MRKDSGEVLIGCLIGLAIGVLWLGVSADKKAQEIANRTGQSISGLEVIADQPMQSIVTIVTPSLAGAGLGLLVDSATGGKEKQGHDVTVGGDGNIIVIGSGGDGNGDINVDDSENPTSVNNNTEVP